MGTSQSLLAYEDCIDYMQQALDDEKGIRLEFATHEEAMQYRLRLNAARNAVRRNNAQIYPDPAHQYHLKSHYDALVFRLKRIDGRFWIYLETSPYEIKSVESLSTLPEGEHIDESPADIPLVSRRRL